MPTHNGKVNVDGVVDLAGTEAFVLDGLQALEPSWVGQPFLTAFDPATWLSPLEPPSRQGCARSIDCQSWAERLGSPWPSIGA